MSAARIVAGCILALERQESSAMGNPAWSVAFQVDGGDCILGRTEADSTLGYELAATRVGVPCEASYIVTSAGVVFTGIQWRRP